GKRKIVARGAWRVMRGAGNAGSAASTSLLRTLNKRSQGTAERERPERQRWGRSRQRRAGPQRYFWERATTGRGEGTGRVRAREGPVLGSVEAAAMIPASFSESNDVLDKPPDMDRDKCGPLPVLRSATTDGVPVIVSCW